MTKKVYYNNRTVKNWIFEIIQQINADNWRPDCIVGITRGGLVPAVMLSHWYNVPLHTVKISLRDFAEDTESNLWLPEMAFGHINYDLMCSDDGRKNMLIVDDINDSGATFQWLVNDWQSSCLPSDSRWGDVWHNNVKFATLINNEASDFKTVDYTGLSINKVDDPIWCVLPWEEFWR